MAMKTPARPAAAASLDVPTTARPGRPSALLDTRVVYCGDNLEQLANLPDACVDLIYIDPVFKFNRKNQVCWGKTIDAPRMSRYLAMPSKPGTI